MENASDMILKLSITIAGVTIKSQMRRRL